MNLIQLILLPFSLIYGLIASLRNKFFDWNLLPSETYDIPIISVGNLSCGGTGKTPHVEYLIRLLRNDFKLATLSRGYKRTTSGFLLCNNESTYKDIGDEPLQYCKKFKDIQVSVDENRRNGIRLLKKHFPEIQIILLDDAFQHRYVKPGLQLLTTDFHNLYMEDYPLPSGTLREFRCGAKRADIIIVTKCPRVLSPITKRRITNLIKPRSYQQLFFSFIHYGNLVSLSDHKPVKEKLKFSSILMFAGIANSYPLLEHLKNMCNDLSALEFADHHSYNRKDLERIKEEFDKIFTKSKAIITTEKDAMRLDRIPEYSGILQSLPIYYVPIEIKFHNGDSVIFDDSIKKYVGESQRSPQLSKKSFRSKA